MVIEIQINHQLDATVFPVYYLKFICSSTCFGSPHAPKVKPEAATAVVEPLMMGVRTPETF
jgi:hypothetical protein